MKSLRYILTGKARTMADFLDLARREAPQQVDVDLAVRLFPTDRTVWVESVAEYRWRFDSRTGHCREVCGCHSILDGGRRRTRCIAEANARLERSLRRLEEQSIPVVGADKRFDDCPTDED
jgi:hypothetical protein